MMSLSMKETASVLGMAPETAKKWLKKGLLKGFKLPGTAGWRIPVTFLIKLGVPAETAKELAKMAREEILKSRKGGGKGHLIGGGRILVTVGA